MRSLLPAASRRAGALASLLGALLLCGAPRVQAQDTASVARDATTYLAQRVDQLAESAPSDPFSLQHGQWLMGVDPSKCPRCQLGPALASAVLATRIPGSAARYRAYAEATVERILVLQNRDGGFPPSGGGASNDVETQFVAGQLGSIAVLLDGQLSLQVRRRWSGAVARSARYLLANGDLHFYVNGNVNLGFTLVFGLAARLMRDPALTRAYEESWKFLLAPDQARWPKYGLRVAVAGDRSDGADGAAYLGEAGASGAGFDAHYVQLQADVATRIWLLLKDPRARRLANLETNMLLGIVDRKTWQLDTSLGSRHPSTGLAFPFITASMAAAAACRTDLDGSADAQLASSEKWFNANLDPHSLEDNDSWGGYLGMSFANFALLDRAAPCAGSGGAFTREAGVRAAVAAARARVRGGRSASPPAKEA